MTKRSYDLYGINAESINWAMKLVEKVLEIKMFLHESGYRCGEYYRSHSIDTDEESFILQKNYDEFDEEWTEIAFDKYPYLLYVDDTLRSKEIKNIFDQIEEARLLKHEQP